MLAQSVQSSFNVLRRRTSLGTDGPSPTQRCRLSCDGRLLRGGVLPRDETDSNQAIIRSVAIALVYEAVRRFLCVFHFWTACLGCLWRPIPAQQVLYQISKTLTPLLLSLCMICYSYAVRVYEAVPLLCHCGLFALVCCSYACISSCKKMMTAAEYTRVVRHRSSRRTPLSHACRTPLSPSPRTKSSHENASAQMQHRTLPSQPSSPNQISQGSVGIAL